MEINSDIGLPSSKSLEHWLDLSLGGDIEDFIEKSLLNPLKSFLKRPSKKFRAQLVQLGFDLVPQKIESASEYVLQAQAVLEAIHAASLVVDDIQDNSDWRRGEPTLHKTHGVAVALNSANWLYFWPFETIETWEVDAQKKSMLIRACYRALIRAHSGQALDVGTPISEVSQKRIRSICFSSLELKTGALTALALELGAILAGASPEQNQRLVQFGAEFGVALQMFDDLGNVREKTPPDPKRFEDLKGRRPSWIWAVAAQRLSEVEFSEFIKLVETLPDEGPLKEYFKTAFWLREAFSEAAAFLNQALLRLESHPWNTEAIGKMQEVAQQLKRAYE
ncbi:hypothetical protein EBR03_06955 [bacterium]|nr:hypothetical protein [bacterium]